MLDRPLIAAIAAACLACIALGYVTGCSEERSANAAASAAAQADAAASAALWSAEARHLRKDRDAAVARVAAEYGRLLDELRDRPGRLPEAARGGCRGSTGAELSAADGSFLAGEAAQADTLRAGLAECYAWRRLVTGRPPLKAEDAASGAAP